MIATIVTPKGESVTGEIHEWVGPATCRVETRTGYTSPIGVLKETYERRVKSVADELQADWALFDEWHVRCKSCTYARRFGQARITALTAADKHSRRYPLHAVQVLKNDYVVEYRIPERMMQTLPGLADLDKSKIKITAVPHPVESSPGIPGDVPPF